MSSRLYLASPRPLAGKTLAAMAVALEARSRGLETGYMKPIGVASSLSGESPADEDASTIRTVLELEEEADFLCPFILPRDEYLGEILGLSSEQIRTKISSTLDSISKDKDVVLIEGPPSCATGSSISASVPELAAHLDAPIIWLCQFDGDHALEELISWVRLSRNAGAESRGVVLNKVPKDRLERIGEAAGPILERNDIPLLGTIHEDSQLKALTVREIVDAVDGKVLAGEEGLDRLVGPTLVGAMTMESAIKYFRRARDELVITGGDRTDIVLAAMEAGASAVILTGNLYPSVKIFPRADDLRIPIILVPHDTFTTLGLVERTSGKIKPSDAERLGRARDIFSREMNIDLILEGL